ncbi:ATP-dependent RNA helicase [Rhizina undulata]
MAGSNASKRARSIAGDNPRKRAKHAEPEVGKKKKGVSIDELEWREVAMPDRLDDVEGFFGLEEVDGVEVSGVEEGRIEYCVVERKIGKKGKGAGGKKEKEEETEKGEEGGEEGGEEWTGFGSDEEDGGVKVVEEKKTKPAKKEPKKKDPKKKQPSPAGILKPSSNPNTNSFAALLDEDNDVSLPAWNDLSLSTPTLRALQTLNFTAPTKIQSSAIPHILAGHDLIGKASTGSGKTLAFGIPILEYYLSQQELRSPSLEEKSEDEKSPIALVLSPTRELAHQLHQHITDLAAFVPEFRVVTLTGGLSLQKQLRQLGEGGGADVVIATPGRLWEVVSEGTGWIQKFRRGLKFLVVDEADRLLQEGHFKEVEEVLNLLGRSEEEDENDSSDEDSDAKKKPQKKKVERQTLVFSATFHKGLQQKLSSKGGKKALRGGDLMGEKESMAYLLKKLRFRESAPQFIDVNPINQLADRLKEGIIECGAMEKDLYLYYLLLRYPSRTLIFTNSISSVKRLAPMLSELQLPAYPLHSNMIQKARLRNLERFDSKENAHTILIATDVAARGLDIKNVEMVIHYHLPRTADMYVHRSGRTARGVEARGVSVLLCAPEEISGVRRLVGKVHEEDGNIGAGKYLMRSFDVDRKLATRLKRRVELAKKIADSGIEKQRKGHEDEWLKKAADELGVEYDSEEFERGLGKKGKRKESETPRAGDLKSWRGELKALLATRVNSGFSERYLTAGSVNLAQALVDGGVKMHEAFLGLEMRSAVDEVGG